jgi:hypothetical protein
VGSNPNLWLLGIGIAYPVLLFSCLVGGSDPPWWLLDRGPALVFVLFPPTVSAATLVSMRLRGARISWLAVLLFALWLGLVAWGSLYLLGEAAASV